MLYLPDSGAVCNLTLFYNVNHVCQANVAELQNKLACAVWPAAMRKHKTTMSEPRRTEDVVGDDLPGAVDYNTAVNVIFY